MQFPSKKDFKPYLDEINLCQCFVCLEKAQAYAKFAEYKRVTPHRHDITQHHTAMVELYTQLSEGRHKRVDMRQRAAIDAMVRREVDALTRIDLIDYPFCKPIGEHEAQWHKRNGRDPRTGTNKDTQR